MRFVTLPSIDLANITRFPNKCRGLTGILFLTISTRFSTEKRPFSTETACPRISGKRLTGSQVASFTLL